MPRVLFLLGGGHGALEAVQPAFLRAAGPDPRLVLLLQGGPRWERYLPLYTNPWVRRGIRRYRVIVPDADGTLDLERAARALREATGIFIGGGHTGLYQKHYATEPLGSLIRTRYRQGVPVAGLSAGAILASSLAWLLPEESPSGRIEVIPGLGLIQDLIVAPHFSEWNALPDLLEAMRRSRVSQGLGIDEEAVVVFENERVQEVYGGSAYRVVLTGPGRGAYRLERWPW